MPISGSVEFIHISFQVISVFHSFLKVIFLMICFDEFIVSCSLSLGSSVSMSEVIAL